MRGLVSPSTFLIFTWCIQSGVYAQFGNSDHDRFRESRLEIVYQGPERSLTFLNAMAARVRPEVPGEKQSAQPFVVQFVTAPEQAELNHDIQLHTLQVYWPKELDLSKEEQQALLEDARKKIESELQRMQSLADNARQARKQAELDELIRARKHVQVQLNDVVLKLSATQSTYGLTSMSEVSNQRARAATRLWELQIQEAGISARRKAVEERIDQLRKETQAGNNQDSEILKELERLVGIRGEQLKKMKSLNAAGVIGRDGEVQEAEAALAKARIDLLSAKKDMAESASAPALRELNNELSNLTIQAADNSGQQERVKQLFEGLPSAQNQLEFTALQQQSRVLQERLTELTQKIQARQTDEVAHPPTKLRPLVEVEAEQEKK